jgi:HAE1 family hydrophobic/amphiphilic exporter-1
VAQVNIIGGQEREIQVSLDAIKMQGMAFRFRATGNLSSNLDFPTGNIQTREKKS